MTSLHNNRSFTRTTTNDYSFYLHFYRRKLGCKSFKWYLDNIYPELFIPGEAVASGEVKSNSKSRIIRCIFFEEITFVENRLFSSQFINKFFIYR